MRAKQIPGVPEQVKGSFHDTESQQHFDDPLTARQHFEVLKERFFSINRWNTICGKKLADFRLYDSYGQPVDRVPRTGDFIRIDIPGPGNTEAKGFDWVKITDILQEKDERSERILIICNPSASPQNDSSGIAHFYSSEATSTFLISCKANTLETAVYGRNESPNLKTTFINTLRSLLIALGGMCGLSKIQWKSLTDGLLNFK